MCILAAGQKGRHFLWCSKFLIKFSYRISLWCPGPKLSRKFICNAQNEDIIFVKKFFGWDRARALLAFPICIGWKEIRAKNKEDNFLFVPTVALCTVQALVVLLHHHQGLSCPPTMSHKKMSFSEIQENRFDYKAWLGAAKERNKKEDWPCLRPVNSKRAFPMHYCCCACTECIRRSSLSTNWREERQRSRRI